MKRLGPFTLFELIGSVFSEVWVKTSVLGNADDRPTSRSLLGLLVGTLTRLYLLRAQTPDG